MASLNDAVNDTHTILITISIGESINRDFVDVDSMIRLADKLESMSRGWKEIGGSLDDQSLNEAFKKPPVRIYVHFQDAIQDSGIWNVSELDDAIASLRRIYEMVKKGDCDDKEREEKWSPKLALLVESMKKHINGYIRSSIAREGGL